MWCYQTSSIAYMIQCCFLWVHQSAAWAADLQHSHHRQDSADQTTPWDTAHGSSAVSVFTTFCTAIFKAHGSPHIQLPQRVTFNTAMASSAHQLGICSVQFISKPWREPVVCDKCLCQSNSAAATRLATSACKHVSAAFATSVCDIQAHHMCAGTPQSSDHSKHAPQQAAHS